MLHVDWNMTLKPIDMLSWILYYLTELCYLSIVIYFHLFLFLSSIITMNNFLWNVFEIVSSDSLKPYPPAQSLIPVHVWLVVLLLLRLNELFDLAVLASYAYLFILRIFFWSSGVAFCFSLSVFQRCSLRSFLVILALRRHLSSASDLLFSCRFCFRLH